MTGRSTVVDHAAGDLEGEGSSPPLRGKNVYSIFCDCSFEIHNCNS